MFESYTYDKLLADVLKNAPEGVDTRQGSIFYDAISGILLKIAKMYTDLDLVMDLCFITTTTGDSLTLKAAEYAIYRKEASPAKYYFIYEGTCPDLGERFYNDGHYFVLCQDDDGALYLEAEVAGESENYIYEGTEAIPVSNLQTLTAASFGVLYEAGADEEDDDDLRDRLQEKIAGPAENGNKQHYKTWCESIEGVGRARIFPLWNGENTVKAVLIDTTGHGCAAGKVAEVQEYIDPADKGMTVTIDGVTYVVGDGLGNGVANIGAHFTAVAANSLTIDVTFTAELATGATSETVQEEATEAVEEYLKNLVLDADDDAVITVRVSAIGAILSSLKTLVDYTDLKLNGDTKNIVPGEDNVPVLGEVNIS